MSGPCLRPSCVVSLSCRSAKVGESPLALAHGGPPGPRNRSLRGFGDRTFKDGFKEDRVVYGEVQISIYERVSRRTHSDRGTGKEE